MAKTNPEILSSCPHLFDTAQILETNTSRVLLNAFNKKHTKLFDLPTHKRIFLFIFTRAIKTFSSIYLLCQNGYGQDVAALLRSLLENLISVKYILINPNSADEKTRRFVAYKWIILKKRASDPNEPDKNITDQSEMILKHVEAFKKDFSITSDRALLTWSGKTIKDMAKSVNKNFAKEYESTYRLCSRFSHASILGDNEYMIQNDQNLTFSPNPSPIGIKQNLERAIKYTIEFLNIANSLFELNQTEILSHLKTKFQEAQSQPDTADQLDTQTQNTPPANIRESTIYFEMPPS